MLYMGTFTINIPPMLAYIPYMDPMGYIYNYTNFTWTDHLPDPTASLAAEHWCGDRVEILLGPGSKWASGVGVMTYF